VENSPERDPCLSIVGGGHHFSGVKSLRLLFVLGVLPAVVSCAEGDDVSSADSPDPGVVAAADAASLRITFLGTGSPRPSLVRYGPSILVEAGDQRVLIDASWGLRERLLQVGGFALITGLDHVLLTHLHFDHTIGLADLWLTGWLYGRSNPLRVEGPAGTSAMMSNLQEAFQWDVDYRKIVGITFDPAIVARDITDGVIYERDGLVITAFDVAHMPIDLETRELLEFPGQTLGFRVDFKGHSAVFSGDTRPSDNLVRMASGVDVLVHEVQVPSPEQTDEARRANVSLSVHSTPSQVADIFRRARPRLAVYSHIIPPDVTVQMLLDATDYDGDMAVAHDLMMITIGDEIEVGERPLEEARTFEDSEAIH